MKTNKQIEDITVNEGDVTHIFENLNPNKSNGWDNVPIGTTEICDQSTPYPLKHVFIDFFQEGIFSEC